MGDVRILENKLSNPETPQLDRKKSARKKSAAREYLEAFGSAIIIALVMRASLVQAYVIPSGSMIPTLQIGDHILVNKIRFGLRLPDSVFGLKVPGLPLGHYLCHFEPIARGDVVVLVSPVDPSTDLIKRVVAIPGDSVMVRSGKLFLNGHPIADTHAHFEIPDSARTPAQARNPRDNFGPVTVPAGKLFLMGDNRDNSYDSRYWGFADLDAVEGRAMVVYGSWDPAARTTLPAIRWDRFGHVID
jgi:signal peptidase I